MREPKGIRESKRQIVIAKDHYPSQHFSPGVQASAITTTLKQNLENHRTPKAILTPRVRRSSY